SALLTRCALAVLRITSTWIRLFIFFSLPAWPGVWVRLAFLARHDSIVTISVTAVNRREKNFLGRFSGGFSLPPPLDPRPQLVYRSVNKFARRGLVSRYNTGMPVSDEQLANNAREALNAIITGQVSSMSEGARSLTHLSVA